MKTKIYYYYFDISKVVEKEKYKTLCKMLKKQGLTCFRSISPDHSDFYKKYIRPLNNTVVELDTKYFFSNQWNTKPTKTSEKGLRVFDWAEPIYPNKDIREGEYLEQIKEMKELRENSYKCGYCGKIYYKPEFTHCIACLDSQYLKEEELHLLTLIKISIEGDYNKVQQLRTYPDHLVELYREGQKIAKNKRLEKDKANKLSRLQNDIESAQKEYNGFKWLIENNINYDNVIYYDHLDNFCFGWREKLQEKEKTKLNAVLAAFPYNYSFA